MITSMITRITLLVTGWATAAWAKLALAGAGVMAAMVLYWRIRREARNEMRVAILEQHLAQANQRKDINAKARGLDAAAIDRGLRSDYRD